MRQFYRKFHHYLSSRPAIRGLLKGFLYLSVGLTVFVLTLQLPLSEKTAYFFRHGYNLWLLAAVLLLYGSFKIPGVTGRLTSYSLILILFALPLAALWRQGYAEMQMIGGVLHFSDSAQYYHNASRLLEGFAFTSFGTRHPFAPALIASLLAFTGGHLMVTTAILVFFNAIGVYLTAYILQKSEHAATASVFILLSFLFYRRFIGMTDTENLGLLFGMLGFDLLFIGASTRKIPVIFSGILITAFGLNARPGPFLILPALLVWCIIHFLKNHKTRMASRILLLIVFMLIPFLLNLTLAASLGASNPGVFSNFAYTLYGMADGGSGWEQIYRDHPEIAELSEAEATRLAYRLAVEKVKRKPTAVIQSAATAYLDLFSLKNRSAFGYVSGGELTAFDQPAGDHILRYQITRAILWILSILGTIQILKQRRRLEISLLFWGLMGILLSVPFLPPRDAGMMRVYAAAMPYWFLLPIYGIGIFFPNRSEISEHQQELKTTAALVSAISLALVSLMVLMPLSLRMARKPLPLMDHTCQSGEYAAALRLREGSYLYVQIDEQGKPNRLPSIQHSTFVENLVHFPNAKKVEELTSLSPPFLLLNAVNLENGKMFWAVAQPRVFEDMNRPLLVCGHWMPGLLENGLGFLYINTYTALK